MIELNVGDLIIVDDVYNDNQLRLVTRVLMYTYHCISPRHKLSIESKAFFDSPSYLAKHYKAKPHKDIE